MLTNTRTWVAAAVLTGSCGLIGCSGDDCVCICDDDDLDAGVVDAPDVGGDAPIDAPIDAGDAQTCDPVAQTGCGTGEKCTWMIDVAGPPLVAHTGCAPDGDKGAGAACTTPETGADDCVAGSYCLDGVCTEICSTTPNSCPEGFICRTHAELLDDVDDVGLCDASCDPVQQDCANTADACYLNLVLAEGTCAGTPTDAATQTQDMPCYGPGTGGCYLNGCAKGHGPVLPNDTCAFFCSPIDNWSGNVNGLTGDPTGIPCDATFGGARPDGPGSSYECRFIQSFYSGAEHVPATLGMCVDPAGDYGGGSCATFDLPRLIADITSGTTIDQTYCTVTCPECCLIDCVSQETLASMLP